MNPNPGWSHVAICPRLPLTLTPTLTTGLTLTLTPVPDPARHPDPDLDPNPNHRPEEIRRYTFAIWDNDNFGWITQDNLLEMLTMLHPHNQGPVTVRGYRSGAEECLYPLREANARHCRLCGRNSSIHGEGSDRRFSPQPRGWLSKAP